jgi:acyl carrier protein
MKSQAAIQSLVVSKLAEILQLTPAAIAPVDSVFALGLDSSGALSLVGHLEDTLEITIDPAMMWEFPHIEDLSEQLTQISQAKQS